MPLAPKAEAMESPASPFFSCFLLIFPLPILGSSHKREGLTLEHKTHIGILLCTLLGTHDLRQMAVPPSTDSSVKAAMGQSEVPRPMFPIFKRSPV